MGIQINGQTDTVSSTTSGGSVKVTPLSASTGLNVGTGASISSPATNVLTLGTNNVESVRIDSSGRLGIGTIPTSISAKLTVASNALSSASASTDGGIVLTPTTNLSTGQYTPAISFSANASSPNRSRAGIVAVSNNGASGMDLVFLTRSSADGTELVFSTDEKVRITSSGNVGINSTVPRSALDVGGELILGRQDSSQEGGQVSLCRSSDNTSTWSIDAYGSTSTPSLRFVDNIAGAARMSVDGSGRVTMPYQPRAHIRKTGSGTITTTPAVIPFETETYDTANNFSSNRFTAPVSGYYLVAVNVNILATTNTVSIDIRLNGSLYGNMNYSFTSGNIRTNYTMTGVVNAAASDYIEIYGYVNTSTVTIDNAGHLSIALLG